MKRLLQRGKNKWWFILLVLAVLIKLLSYFPLAVEKYYSQGIYLFTSRVQRFLLGWLSFSVGDILYVACIFFLIIAFGKLLRKLFRWKKQRIKWGSGLKQVLFVLLLIYVLFYGLWGLNYSRIGITSQFDIPIERPTAQNLDTLVQLLHSRINKDAAALPIAERETLTAKNVFAQAQEAYKLAAAEYPFLKSSPSSVKSSLFGTLMNYTGVQGYYNPFSGEAQVNTTIPSFLLPSVATHEIGHQVGYGMESEANFLSFLTSRKHPSIHFQYSTDFVMYLYARSELFLFDSVKTRQYDSTLHPQVIKDIREYRAFYQKYQSRIEPVIDWLYGNYLKANNQPSGKRSYDEVVVWLIGWYRKHGPGAI